jgi:hypothetical protein
MLDEALGYQAFTATGGSDTLTIPDGTTGVARSIYIQLNGTGGGTVNVPTAKTKMYFVFNNTASAITFKVTGQTGVSIPAAAKIALVSNGTDIITAENYLAALTLGAALPVASGGTGTTSTTFVNLATNVTGTLPVANGGTGTTSTTFVNLATNVTGTLPVANGGTSLATLTANNVLLGNGTSAPTFVAPSTSGNVLTSNGTTWQSTAPAVAFTLLSTVTASNSATVDVETTFSSTYDAYMLVVSGLTLSTFGVQLLCQMKIGGSYVTTSTYISNRAPATTTILDTSIVIMSSIGGDATAADNVADFQMQIYNPASTAFAKVVAFQGSNKNTDTFLPRLETVAGGGLNTGTGALTGLRFFATTGNISAGKFRLYGISN